MEEEAAILANITADADGAQEDGAVADEDEHNEGDGEEAEDYRLVSSKGRKNKGKKGGKPKGKMDTAAAAATNPGKRGGIKRYTGRAVHKNEEWTSITDPWGYVVEDVADLNSTDYLAQISAINEHVDRVRLVALV